MLDILVYKLATSGVECSGKDCKQSPEYFDHIIGKEWRIKQGTVCARLMLSNDTDSNNPLYAQYEWYCRDCIGELYQLMKSKLDSKLWVFQ